MRSKLIADVEVEMAAGAELFPGDRKAVVDAERPDGQIEPETDTDVRGEVARIEVVSAGVDQAGIEEGGEAHFGNDRESLFHCETSERAAADRFAVDIAG